MFSFLDELVAASSKGTLTSAAINSFEFEERSTRLIVQTGIWKPAALSAALTIRTAFTPPNQPPPYEDDIGPEGMVRYKYRGTDPDQSDNRALRQAMVQQLPLAYFVGVDKGVYIPQYPVWLVEEDPAHHRFAVAVDEGQRYFDLANLTDPQKAYVEQLTRRRLHQPVFRARVLVAYGERCAICRLHHARLLDAAHIIPDGEPMGDPVVPNGLALCKIHHAAYDANLLGIRPDLTVDVAQHLLDEHDGPMLRHGLQEMAGTRLSIPRQRAAQPEPERLEHRYEQFLAAS
jgi:putative restriction endonuclease